MLCSADFFYLLHNNVRLLLRTNDLSCTTHDSSPVLSPNAACPTRNEDVLGRWCVMYRDSHRVPGLNQFFGSAYQCMLPVFYLETKPVNKKPLQWFCKCLYRRKDISYRTYQF